MKKVNWIKITGTAALLHIVLAVLSFFEVVIYSYYINKGQNNAFYEAHATKTAPYISGIFGSVLIYFFVIQLTKRKRYSPFLIGIGLPLLYTLLDVLLLITASANWAEQLNAILISNLIKLAIGIIAAFVVKLSKK